MGLPNFKSLEEKLDQTQLQMAELVKGIKEVTTLLKEQNKILRKD